MNLKTFSIIIPMIVSFFSKGWGDDLDISFRKAVMNDIQQNKWRVAVIPAALISATLTTLVGLVFVVYGAATWFLDDVRSAEVLLATGGALFVAAILFATALMVNVRFILRRVETVQDTLIRAQEARPFQQLYRQIKEEQNLFLEAIQERKQQKRRFYESNNISTV